MSLEQVRSEISRVDTGILRLIGERQALAGQVAEIKIMKGISIHDEKRSAEVLSSVFDRAVEMKIDPVAVRKIFEILIAMSEDRQRELTDEGNLP
jgi:chorismate mutase